MNQCAFFMVLISIFGSLNIANADPNQAEIVPLFAPFQSLPIGMGEFIQKKHFKILNQPIESKGQLYFDQNLGMLWQTNEPAYSAMILKKEGVFLLDGVNQPTKINGAGAITKVLMSVMSGNTNDLTEGFDVINSKKKPCIELTPKDKTLAKVILLIELCGEQTLQQINLHEVSGNHTEIAINLSAVTKLPEVVSEQLQ